MRNIILLFLFSLSLSAQTVFTDNFNNFYHYSTTNLVDAYIFSNDFHRRNETSMVTGLENAHTLTASGWSTDYKDEHLFGKNPLNASDSVLWNNGSAKLFSISDANDADFEPGTNSFSAILIAAVFEPLTGAANVGSFISEGVANVASTGYRFGYRGGANPGGGYDGLYLQLGDDADGVNSPDLDSPDIRSEYADSTYLKIALIVDRSNPDSFYVRYKDFSLMLSDSLKDSAGDPIGSITGAGQPLKLWDNFYDVRVDGSIAMLAYYSSALTEKQFREFGYLPVNWISTNGNVTRDLSNPDFFLTAWSDTIGVPLSDATLGANQEWVFNVQSKDTDGSGSTNWWIGKKRDPKTVVKTVTCGSTFANDKVYFGDGFALQSDTLWVAFSDTASVDNVVLRKESHHLIRNVNRWITW